MDSSPFGLIRRRHEDHHARPCFWHELLPLRVDPSLLLNHSTPSLCLHYQASTLLRVDPSLRHALVLSALGVFPLDLSLAITATGSHVPHKSLSQAHATFTPVIVKAVSRCRLDWSQANDWSLVLMTSQRFRRLISGSLALVFLART
jgi:hypothetical protein